MACFYVKEKDATKPYYRAVYLLRRTVKDLTNGISDKFSIDPTRVTRVTHINSKGLQIIVDEDVVREVPEGQDMIVEFAPIKTEETMKAAPDSLPTVIVDGELSAEITVSDPLEMWLNY